MSDCCDDTDAIIDLHLRVEIANNSRAKPELQPVGSCYNCLRPFTEEELEAAPDKKFCDADCSEDWHYRRSIEARRTIRA